MPNYIGDYHIHTRFSCDSEAELNEICETAISRRLPEIAITDHLDFGPDIFALLSMRKQFSDAGNFTTTGSLSVQAWRSENRTYFQRRQRLFCQRVNSIL